MQQKSKKTLRKLAKKGIDVGVSVKYIFISLKFNLSGEQMYFNLFSKSPNLFRLTIKQSDDFKVDVADPRFSAMFREHDFAIDPTNPAFM